MLGICSACGNHEWDKEVSGNIIRCPKCGHEWKFEKLPIYFLTGCSGIGKTTTALALTADPEVLKKRMTEGRFPSCIYYLCRFIITNKRALWFSNKIKGVWMLNSNKQIILFTGIVA